MNKKIDYLLEGRQKNIGDEIVLQPLPHKDFRFASPFIVLHHLQPKTFKPGSPPVRVHPHPHRGFAPVSFMYQGEGFHKDSEGNSGVIKAGEVQWMFAGSGLLHSEGPTEELLERGGVYEFVQLWVNVPGQHKWDKPYYKQASKEQMPLVSAAQGVELRLASGEFGQLKGPLTSHTPLTSVFGSLGAGKTFEAIATEGYWTLLYILSGAVVINGEQQVGKHFLAIFSKEGTQLTITAIADTKLLYLSAEPIKEPVAAKGNIVMNTQAEIEQAEEDYAEGKFGTLDY